MSGLMQPGPTLYEAEQQRKKKGSRGLLGEIGEPLSYAPGPVGLLGNALLGAQYMTGEKPMDEGLSALAMLTGLMQGTKVAPIMNNVIRAYHGTKKEFDAFDEKQLGSNTKASSAKHAFSFASDPKTAEYFANLGLDRDAAEAVDKMRPLLRSLAHTKDQAKRKELQDSIDALSKIASPLPGMTYKATATGGQNIRPVDLDIRNPLIVDFSQGSYGHGALTKQIKKAQQQGYDSLIAKNIIDPWETTNYFVFDADRIIPAFGAGLLGK
jgi:hypothetical protein